MAPSASRTAAAPPRATPAITARHLRFVATAPEGAKVRRTFKQPEPRVAVEETVALADLPAPGVWPEPTDGLHVVIVPRGATGEWLTQAPAWLAAPAQPEAVPTVILEGEQDALHWRPGRALVKGRPERCEELLAALTDFAFYEGELRRLETAVEAHEAASRADVAFAYYVRQRDRKQWNRIRRTMEELARLRLTFARLEPRLAKGARDLVPGARKAVARLLVRTDVEDRLVAVSDRLEALEDLYEGATDRVADFRWYRTGHRLEIGIIVLLLLEVLLMSADLYVRYMDYQDAKVEAATTDLSEEWRVTITKVADGYVTFTRTVAGKDTTLTMPVIENVKVARGRLDRDTREVEIAGAIEGGLSNELFARAGDQAVRAIVVTNSTNKKIAEIYVLGTGRRG
jgi:hypothetical protein